MKEYIDISGLLPDFFSIWPFPGFAFLNAEYLSLVFISVMLFISTLFLLVALWSSIKTGHRIRRLKAFINGKRNSPEENGKRKKSVDHLWNEFKKTLIEVRSVDAHGKESVLLYNTIDSSHFFNTSTLAAELTENRLLAAVPGFLTGIGVLGTFIGLQLGLSELNIGDGVAVEEMITGLAQVISGAKIAFLTSVWGVGLSIVFNFFEKLLERRARGKIRNIQNQVDAKYPRLTPERQLQQISDHSAEMRESLQHLGEKIGDRLQTAIEGLGKSFVGPNDASKNALNTLIQEFLSEFKKVGGDQAAGLIKANDSFATALNSLDSSMTLLLKQLNDNQNSNVAHGKELMQKMSGKVDELVVKSNKQHEMLTEFMSKTFADIGNSESKRTDSTNSMLQRLESTMKNQLEASGELIKQGEKLQQGINASVQGNVDASTRMKESAAELNEASQHMKATGRSIENAGVGLSNSITKAIDSTTNLAKENQAVHLLLNNHQQTVNQQQQQLNDSADKINKLLDTAQNSFDKMDEGQRQFLQGLAENVNELSSSMSLNLKEYSEGLNSATEAQLKAWTKSTTDYSAGMNGAIRSLSTIVDEMDGKLAASK